MYQAVPLPYKNDALEPVIDTKTVTIHYGKHYMNYLNKLNDLLKKNDYRNEFKKEELVNHLDMFPLTDRGDILYQLGGVLNHELYFASMGSNHHEPIGTLKDAIIKQYGSISNFQQEFIKTAGYLVGSGYTFLVLDSENKLLIINMSNQDTPYSYGLIPVLALDLWEHAYYLNYLNDRNRYIQNFFTIINFDQANTNYEKAITEKK